MILKRQPSVRLSSGVTGVDESPRKGPFFNHAHLLRGGPWSRGSKLMKTFSVSIAIIILSSAWFAASAADPITIVVGAYENAPKIYTADDGSIAGFWPDLLRAIASQENWEIEWVPGTWQESLQRLQANKIDILPDTGWTEQRSQVYDFNQESVLISWARVYVPKGSDIESILDLEGKAIAGLRDSLNMDGPEGIKDLTTRLGMNSTFVEMDSYTQVFAALENKEVDAGTTNKDFGNANERNYAVERTAIILQPAQIQFAFTKGTALTPILIEAIDADLRQMKQDPQSVYYRALQEHLGERPVTSFVGIIPVWLKSLLMLGGATIAFLLAVGVTSRIQVRRRTAALSESEERYRQLVENAPVGIVIHSQRKVIYANPTTARLLGATSPQSLIGRNILDFVHPDYQQIVLERVRAVQAADQSIPPLAEKLLRLDGSAVDVEVTGVPLVYQGQPAFQLIITDITERKRAKAALSRRADEFAALYDTARALTEQQDMHGRLKLITDHAAALLNASLGFVYLFDSESNDLILMVAKDSPIPIATRLRLGEGMAGRVAQDLQPLIVDDYHVWEGRSPRYEGAPFSAVVEVPMIHSGELVGVLGVREAGDTTRRFTEEDVRLLSLFAAQAASAVQNARLLEKLKRNTEQLEQRVVERTAELEVAKEGAESADRLKSIFLASMSHELRTPLNSIIGFTGILLQGMSGELNDEQRKQLSLVQGSGRHLLELINDVLDISKIEAGEVRLVLGEFELADLVREVVDSFSPAVTEKGLELFADVPNLAITSDRRRVKQVLMNVVSNAVKFTDQGRVSIIGKVLETQTLEIRVRDTGPGMEEEETKRLFQPFQQIDDSLTRRHEGTGLGLYLTKTLLALLGGDITVKSKYGVGSEFTFTLPVKRGEEGE